MDLSSTSVNTHVTRSHDLKPISVQLKLMSRKHPDPQRPLKMVAVVTPSACSGIDMQEVHSISNIVVCHSDVLMNSILICPHTSSHNLAAVLIHPKYHINNFLFSSASSCDEITKSLFSDRQADVVISNQWHLPIFWQTRFYVHVVISQTITPPLFFLQIFVVISKCLHFFWLKIFCSDITNNNASIFSDWQIFVVISQTIKPPYFLTDNNTSLFSDRQVSCTSGPVAVLMWWYPQWWNCHLLSSGGAP